jgi:hypothetical protein
MTTTGELFPRCALPGCTNPTDTQGHPCGQCRRDFGPMLRHNPDGQPMTAATQTARDQAIGAAYRTRAHTRLEGCRSAACRRGRRAAQTRANLLVVRTTPPVCPRRRSVGMPRLPTDHRLSRVPASGAAERPTGRTALSRPADSAALRHRPGRFPVRWVVTNLRAHVDQV